MKIKLVVLLLVLFISAQTEANAQNAITDMDSIPLVAYIYELDGFQIALAHILGEIDSLRFHSVEILNLGEGQYDDYELFDRNFMIIPDQVVEAKIGGPLRNLIIKYTEAKFSVWQAEGTPIDDGEATIVANPTYTTEENSGKFIFTVDSVQIPYGTELINGPSYVQDALYNSVDPDTVLYLADFRMKLSELIPGIALNSDTVCNLQITTSIYKVLDKIGWAKTDYYVVADTALLFADFDPLNQWGSHHLNYKLTGLPDHFYNNYSRPINDPEPDPGPHWRNDSRNHIQHIEFKIIWKANSQIIRLFVDSVAISDNRGRDLTESDKWPITKQLLENMIHYNYNYKNKISGWFGLDEPHSIDNFEPIRIISELLESQTGGAKLWISLPGSWSGRWGNPGHPLSAGERIHIIDEYFKRVKRGNVLQNLFPLEMPYSYQNAPLNTDPRLLNIDRIADSTYAHFNKFIGANWGSGILTGAVPKLKYEEVDKYEMLYSTNLALLFGAKIIAPWLIYGKTIDPGDSTATGLINLVSENVFERTEKYYTMRDTISPRLGGLLGKTLKILEPDSQFAGSSGANYSALGGDNNPEGYDFIEDVWPYVTVPSTEDCGVDIGLFRNPTDITDKYFMILNRYYSNRDKYYIKIRSLSDFMNWNLTNYIDTTSQMFISENQSINFLDTLYKGDANLYSIIPVVKAGGIIAVDDTISTNITLSNKMTINNNAELFIKAGKFYTVQDTITLGGLGSRILGDGYLELASGGEVIIYNWSHSLFKGKQNNNPKLFWGKFTGNAHTGYKIYRKKETSDFVEISTLPPSERTYTDTTVFIIEGPYQSNEVAAEYYVTAVYENGRSTSNSDTIIYQRVEGSGLDKLSMGTGNQPLEYSLSQNYPNPFNPTTTIKYSVKEPGVVELDVLNILGQKVNELVNEFQSDGNYEVTFNASSLASGIYLYRIKVNDFVSTKKMILVK